MTSLKVSIYYKGHKSTSFGLINYSNALKTTLETTCDSSGEITVKFNFP